jgi:hypothetical protein
MQPLSTGFDDGGEALRLARQGKQCQTGRFQMGGLIGSIAPTAAINGHCRQISERITHIKAPTEK